MMWTLFWLSAGLLIGWNVLPQPEWARALWLRASYWLSEKVGR